MTALKEDIGILSVIHLLLTIGYLLLYQPDNQSFIIFFVLLVICTFVYLAMREETMTKTRRKNFGSALDVTIITAQHTALLSYLYITLTKPLESPLVLYFQIAAIYHLLEFYFTLAYRPNQLIRDAFLIYHSPYYQAAFWLSLCEYYITFKLFAIPKLKIIDTLTALKVGICLFGLLIRSAAFYYAGPSFHHLIQSEKQEQHVLVTTGVYRWDRHPSYVGFYIYSVMLQLVIGNVVCFALFAVFLLYFFKRRIEIEEYYLYQFFKLDYLRYIRKTNSLFDVEIKGFPKSLKQKLVYRD